MHTDLPPVTEALGLELRTARSKSQALGAEALAALLGERGYVHVDARRIRELISTHYPTLCAMVQGVLVAESPAGYWIAGTTEDLEAREALLWSLEKQARKKRLEFIAQVKASGLGAILPDREKEVAA